MTEPTSVSTKPLFPMQRHLSQSETFGIAVIDNTIKQTLNLVIEHFQEDKLNGKHHISVTNNDNWMSPQN